MRSHRQDSQNQTGRAFQALSSILPAGFEALNKRGDLPFHIWYAGSINFGSLNGDGSYDNRFSTSGLTVGFDRRFFDGFKAGIAFGAGLDHTTVGTDGTKSDSYAYNATLYASYRFLPHTFLDAIAGYGRMNFTLSRWSSDGDLFLAGNRGGSDVYGSLVLTQVFKWDAWKLSPYTRLDVVHIDLGI
ncbi:MAG: autotransporter outer membrane beta-barrel domain-containing protein [Beijerinckiaceae bacterium]